MKFFSLLTTKQRENFGLLQMGTLLEYFDLMLYVHMSFLLNEIFFPKTDPRTAMLISAFALCSTYLLRPIGALIFGYIGDKIGRKSTVILSSMMMGISCIIMANLPTYSQIGIMAAWGVTLCRVLQSLSAQGEIIGVEIYLTETTKAPARYSLVSLTSFFASVGGMLAIGLSNLLTLFEISWRIAFWVGAGISSIGLLARTQLRETPEFIVKKIERNLNPFLTREPLNKKTLMAYFLISCGYPACFYLAYIYLGNILKINYHYSAENVIQQNFILSVAQCLSFLVYALLSYKINPLKILKYRWVLFFGVMFFYPYWLEIINSPFQILMLQIFLMVFGIIDVPAAGLIMRHFPVMKRFTSASLIYALSRMVIYVITSFGFIYLSDYLAHWGIWLLMMLLSIGFLWGIYHFEHLEHQEENLSNDKNAHTNIIKDKKIAHVP